MNLQDYKDNKQQLYESFARTVRSILKAAICNSGHPYQLQQIQYRAKTVFSLEKKLADRGIDAATDIEREIKDLAGCRIIFYYNDDVNVFIKSGVIYANFKVHWEESNIHYPTKPESANDYYIANHYVVELNDERADLPEYSAFKGLKCETQVHTILNHAWSETAHDIIYKKPRTDGFGSRRYEAIDKRLAKVMQDFLIPAGYEFQKIQDDFQRLMEGKKLFDRNVIKEIETAPDNNQRYEILEKYKAYVLTEYDDFVKAKDEIMQIVQVATDTARKTSTVVVETPFGTFPGKNYSDILDISLDILEYVRYTDVEAVFSLICQLYTKSKADKDVKKILEAVDSLATYNVEVLKKIGIHVQTVLIDLLEEWDGYSLRDYLDIVVKICDATLSPTAEGTSSTYKSVTIKRANLAATVNLEEVRLKALLILQRLYRSVTAEADKRKIIGVFHTACSSPYTGDYTDSLLEIIITNCKLIVDFYTEIAHSELYEILESLEEDILFQYRRATDIISGHRWGEEVLAGSRALLESIEKFRGVLNGDERFIVYKMLVGYESVFPPAWDNDAWEFTERDHYREEGIKEYAKSVNKENYAFWKEMILSCLQTESNDLATFPKFGKFLNDLSETKPDFILELLNEHEAELSRFLPALLDGLLKGSARPAAERLMTQWITSGKHLYYCARLFEFNNSLDSSLLKEIFNQARAQNDLRTLVQIMAAIAANHDKDHHHLISELFLPAIKELSKHKDARWVKTLWFYEKKDHILSELNSQEVDVILDNLIWLDAINFTVEDMMLPIAEKYPEKVINFFGCRLEREEASNYSGQYDAIPFNFHKLAEPLSRIPDEALAMVSHWYDGNCSLFIHRGAQLLKNIFPKFPKPFEASLVKFIRIPDENNLSIALAILRNYQGEAFLHDICKEIILMLPDESDWLNEIIIILESTGVVTGEFGLMEAYDKKKQEIEGWLDDRREKIAKFAKKYVSIMEKQIASEKSRVDQEIEIRKHKYGTEEDKQ